MIYHKVNIQMISTLVKKGLSKNIVQFGCLFFHFI